jgi:hypothetical protein
VVLAGIIMQLHCLLQVVPNLHDFALLVHLRLASRLSHGLEDQARLLLLLVGSLLGSTLEVGNLTVQLRDNTCPGVSIDLD